MKLAAFGVVKRRRAVSNCAQVNIPNPRLSIRVTSIAISRTFDPDIWNPSMQDYRVYVVGIDGHFMRSVELSCADDDEANETAKQMLDGHDLELWQLDRKIAQFKSKRE